MSFKGPFQPHPFYDSMETQQFSSQGFVSAISWDTDNKFGSLRCFLDIHSWDEQKRSMCWFCFICFLTCIQHSYFCSWAIFTGSAALMTLQGSCWVPLTLICLYEAKKSKSIPFLQMQTVLSFWSAPIGRHLQMFLSRLLRTASPYVFLIKKFSPPNGKVCSAGVYCLVGINKQFSSSHTSSCLA